MQNTKTVSRHELELEWSTFMFVWQTVITLSVFYYFWVWKLVNTVSDSVSRPTNRILAVCYIASSMWASVLSFHTDPDIYGVSGMLQLISWVLLLILSFNVRRPLAYYLSAQGTPVRLRGIWCFILPFYYQYYMTYNAARISARQMGAQ